MKTPFKRDFYLSNVKKTVCRKKVNLESFVEIVLTLTFAEIVLMNGK